MVHTGARGTEEASRLVVVGSVNQDHFTYVDQFPAPGETVLAVSDAVASGGKGANQAMAAALLGCRVTFIGAVGSDAAGGEVVADLASCGVEVGHIRRLPGTSTGAAYVAVDAVGENTIIVVGGANAVFGPGDLDDAVAPVLADTTRPVILCQGELDADVTRRAAETARAHGIRFVLNLAPVTLADEVTLRGADPLILNEGEALELLGCLDISSPVGEDAPRGRTAALLRDRLDTSVVVTLGRHGAAAASKDGVWMQAPPPVPSVTETTGAGDAFVGALVAGLCAGFDLVDSVRIGVAAGSHAVQSAGTKPSYPHGVPLDVLLERAPAPTRFSDIRS